MLLCSSRFRRVVENPWVCLVLRFCRKSIPSRHKNCVFVRLREGFPGGRFENVLFNRIRRMSLKCEVFNKTERESCPPDRGLDETIPQTSEIGRRRNKGALCSRSVLQVGGTDHVIRDSDIFGYLVMVAPTPDCGQDRGHEVW